MTSKQRKKEGKKGRKARNNKKERTNKRNETKTQPVSLPVSVVASVSQPSPSANGKNGLTDQIDVVRFRTVVQEHLQTHNKQTNYTNIKKGEIQKERNKRDAVLVGVSLGT